MGLWKPGYPLSLYEAQIDAQENDAASRCNGLLPMVINISPEEHFLLSPVSRLATLVHRIQGSLPGFRCEPQLSPLSSVSCR